MEQGLAAPRKAKQGPAVVRPAESPFSPEAIAKAKPSPPPGPPPGHMVNCYVAKSPSPAVDVVPSEDEWDTGLAPDVCPSIPDPEAQEMDMSLESIIAQMDSVEASLSKYQVNHAASSSHDEWAEAAVAASLDQPDAAAAPLERPEPAGAAQPLEQPDPAELVEAELGGTATEMLRAKAGAPVAPTSLGKKRRLK